MTIISPSGFVCDLFELTKNGIKFHALRFVVQKSGMGRSFEGIGNKNE
jgi:hypothetical protein